MVYMVFLLQFSVCFMNVNVLREGLVKWLAIKEKGMGKENEDILLTRMQT